MDKNEMDFLWRLNWWYRPIQCDGIETSVTDYYESFCDWKDTMEINARPAGETDYVDAFIQGLKPDIRLRLESKEKTSTKRLGVAFYDAKLEESLMSIDEAFKKIKAKFEAHKPFDKMSVQFNSEKEKGLIVVASYIDESQIDKRAEKVTPRFAAAKEEAVIELDHGHSEITDSSLTGLSSFSSPVHQEHSSEEVDSCLHISSADSCSNVLEENLSDDEFSGLEDDESLNLDGGTSLTDVLTAQNDSQKETKETHKLFTESNEPIPADKTSIEKAENDDELLELEEESDYNGKMDLNNEVTTFYNDFSTDGIATVSRVGWRPNETEDSYGQKSSTDVPMNYKSLMHPFYEKCENAPTLIECVPPVFDPGTSIIKGDLEAADMLTRHLPSYCMNVILIQPSVIETAGLKSFTRNFCSISIVSSSKWEALEDAYHFYCFDEMSKTFLMKYGCVFIYDTLPKQLSPEQRKGKGKVILTVFDPGGIFGFYNDCWLEKLNAKLVDEWPSLETVSTLPALLYSFCLTWGENGSHQSINSWIGEISSWYEHSATGFCKMKHSRRLMQHSGIHNIVQPSQVHHFPYTDMGIQEFGGSFGLVVINLVYGIVEQYPLLAQVYELTQYEDSLAIAFLENPSSSGKTREHLIMLGNPNAVGYFSWIYESILEIFGDFRSWHLKGCACIYSREMLCNLVVFTQIGRVVMVVFDPGGGCGHYMDFDHAWPSYHVECNAFKYNKYSVFPNVYKTDYAGFNIHIAPTSYGLRFYTGWTIYNIYEHHLDPWKQLVVNFRIGMLAGSCHFPEGRFPGVHKNVVIILESFVWDPGLGVIFFFTLSYALLVHFR